MYILERVMDGGLHPLSPLHQTLKTIVLYVIILRNNKNIYEILLSLCVLHPLLVFKINPPFTLKKIQDH